MSDNDRSEKRLVPKKAFPAEVLALRDQGIPLPTWYCGPLYEGDAELEADALRQLEQVRRDAR
jgi:hypothetical protein